MNTESFFLNRFKAMQARMLAKQAAGDYEPAMTFVIDKGQQRQINEWLPNTVYPAAIEKQKADLAEAGREPEDHHEMCWEMGQPYTGAVGGGLTYEFTPTSIGEVVIAKFDYVDMKLDITDYDCF
jgi:hypothetical protein